MFRWFGKGPKQTPVEYRPPVKLYWRLATWSEAANENSFWKWIFGPSRPFEHAGWMHRKRKQLLSDPEYFLADKVQLIERSDTYLALFKAIYIDEDESQAIALAPKLNRCVPELMTRCPIRELRPRPEQIDPRWTAFHFPGESP